MTFRLLEINIRVKWIHGFYIIRILVAVKEGVKLKLKSGNFETRTRKFHTSVGKTGALVGKFETRGGNFETRTRKFHTSFGKTEQNVSNKSRAK